jgi:IS5 family transposase
MDGLAAQARQHLILWLERAERIHTQRPHDKNKLHAPHAPDQVIHRGKYKTLKATQRRWLQPRQSIEPAIGHAKADHRRDRCGLNRTEGDALHAVLCAAGFNICWLLRDIARHAAKAISLAFNLVAQYAAMTLLAAMRVRSVAPSMGRPRQAIKW